MKLGSGLAVLVLGIYAAVPCGAAFLVAGTARSIESLAVDVGLASLPSFLLAAVSWRLVWPRWKLFGKLLIHPCIYLVLSIYIHHWSIAFGWIHQGLLGLGVHIWFSRKHGFTWYAVEDAERYIQLSKRAVGIPSEPTA